MGDALLEGEDLMLLMNLTTEQMWAFVCEQGFTETPKDLLGAEVACNGCGSKENMACILMLAPYRNKCFKCDAEWLDRDLEGWC